MSETRVVEIDGSRVTLEGPEIRAGQRAPDFRLLDSEMREVALSDSKGKVRFIATFPSLRSGECTHVAGRVGDGANERLKVLYYVVTVDPPSLQARYCSDETGSVHALSDFRNQSFGRSYGVFVNGSKLLAQAVFVVDADDIVRYARYFDSMDWLPEYGEALAALKEALEDCSRD